MKRITLKLALFFIFLICVSSALSFVGSTLHTKDIENEIQLNQKEIAISILELEKKTNLSIEEIVNLMPTSMYEITRIEDIGLIEITKEELKHIENDEIVFLTKGRFHDPITITMVNDAYIKISLYPHNTILKIVASRIWFSLLLYVVIGALLIIVLAKRVVKPILKLTAATQEVAKGNFDIHVETRSYDEIGQLTQNFNKMTRELKNIEYLRKDFITNVSHEFKTPIASIQGFAKLLQKWDLSQREREEYTNIIVEETTRLSNLSSNILKLSKLENQEILEKKVVFSLDEQIRKSILILEHQWSKKNIEFDIHLDKVQYLGDEELLQQVWINLIGNAIKFSHNNSTISIILQQMDEVVEVKIIDHGIGMTEETKKRIFEKFYQGDKAHSYEGSGLGLPLVKRILDLYDAQIYVESNPKKGSTFAVELPL
ncbi:HAMP domain-containing sensor histidine kinase [Clostridium formicaceticum]|uniref:Heme sensor protein HssS n=1 Tax=Clostridium formicaceticum TaxID=1497 RepID=A0AAC9RMM4_9CLOT|nr:HAMP domain-containing sensor histidine kinase [Clostridium formicaceticum]AOY77533.1 two-component sensor histidine kinase [Clostridium formicaceticum]ARE88105.1 Alkaline phosphatase synthesis sensor protein PhoR [Clostridium formicaceticum]